MSSAVPRMPEGICGAEAKVAPLPAPPVDVIVAREGGDAARRYRDRKDNYSLVLPWGWSVRQEVGSLDMVVHAPYGPQGEVHHVTLGVIATTLDKNVDLSLFYDVGKASLLVELPKARVIEEGETVICSLPALWFLVSYPLDKNHNAVIFQYYLLTHGGKRAYILSATAPEGEFATYRPAFEGIINSFREEYRD